MPNIIDNSKSKREANVSKEGYIRDLDRNQKKGSSGSIGKHIPKRDDVKGTSRNEDGCIGYF